MSWASLLGSRNTSQSLSITNFPALGAAKLTPIRNQEKISTLRGEASIWTPPVTPETPVKEQRYSELELGVGIRLGGGEYGSSRVLGRDTITKKTAFAPNVIVDGLMIKMGWVPGHGLGARLQGIVEPIDTEAKFVRYNINAIGGRCGIGF